MILNYSIRLFLILLLLPVVGWAAPKPDLWAFWQADDPQSVRTVDYQAWNVFLEKYLRKGDINLVDYAAVTAADHAALKAFVQNLTTNQVRRLNRAEQKAFWINLYNALTVQVILDHYPVKSIRDIDISPGFFSDGPWGKKLVKIEGQEVSLDDIEHRILRPIFRDNRIHYALNCASIGCPQLQAKAFTAANMEELLNLAAREFTNHPRAVTVRKGGLAVSSLYKWFQVDFGGKEAGVLAHLQQYADESLLVQLKRVQSIDSYDYDWSLNQSSE